MRKKGKPQEWDRLRKIAANMSQQGHEPKVIAKAIGVAAQTVRTWLRIYRARGHKGLESKIPTGRPSALDDSQRTKLTELLCKTPAECGLDKYLWTQQLIADLIQREFGVSYHHDHVGVILKQIGFTHQKPARRARERDEQKIQTWRAEVWPALRKKTPKKTASC